MDSKLLKKNCHIGIFVIFQKTNYGEDLIERKLDNFYTFLKY